MVGLMKFLSELDQQDSIKYFIVGSVLFCPGILGIWCFFPQMLSWSSYPLLLTLAIVPMSMSITIKVFLYGAASQNYCEIHQTLGNVVKPLEAFVFASTITFLEATILLYGSMVLGLDFQSFKFWLLVFDGLILGLMLVAFFSFSIEYLLPVWLRPSTYLFSPPSNDLEPQQYQQPRSRT